MSDSMSANDGGGYSLSMTASAPSEGVSAPSGNGDNGGGIGGESSGGSSSVDASSATLAVLVSDPNVAILLAGNPSDAAILSNNVASVINNGAIIATTLAGGDPFAVPGISQNQSDFGFGITGPKPATPANINNHIGAHMAANLLGFGVGIAAKALGVGQNTALAISTVTAAALNNSPIAIAILDHVTDPLNAAGCALTAIGSGMINSVDSFGGPSVVGPDAPGNRGGPGG